MKSRSIFAAIALSIAVVSCQPQESTTDDTDSTMMSQPDNTMDNSNMNNSTMDTNTMTTDTMGATNMDTNPPGTGNTNTNTP